MSGLMALFPTSTRRPSRFIVMFTVVAAVVVFALVMNGESAILANAGVDRLCSGVDSALLDWSHQSPSHVQTPLSTGLNAMDLTRSWHKHETKFMRGHAGFMMFENLYLHKGVFYAITSDPSSIPETDKILSDPPIPKDTYDINPPATSKRWQVLTPAEADQSLGGRTAGVLAGTSMLFNDGPGKRGFLAHYFHFVAEVFGGGWRVMASSPSNLAKNSAADMSFPARIMMPRGDDWRDTRASLIVWFLSTILPNTAVEDVYQWEDRVKSGATHVFSEIVIVDRWTAHRAQGSQAQIWNKMTADIMASKAPVDWWAPLRTSLMHRLGIENNHRDRPVVTYIDRQATTRRLVDEDHTVLAAALTKFGEEHNVEVNQVQMEFLSKKDQFDISTRTNIVIGVHGNGLTHQMWMKPGGKVLEFYDTGGFMRDYQLLAEAMHHTHYVIWNDTIEDSWREKQRTQTTPNFHNVRLHAPFIIELLTTLVKEYR
ncbi:hypothetical protein HGRIS_014501 [Hohenbuehelia grisea]|uniref:Glycosyltransferase 61 catalytic domain-containing protein n=1 Tax=Hohenbuehelia grisea TaxID=104357 RepID=A0ABR3JTR3_9AGAR